jgi:lysophospholipase L1-like esterase
MKLIKIIKASFLVTTILALVACGGAPDYIESADRNDVVTVGDSIFDLSGDLQRFLEAKAGQTFRDYTISGSKISGGNLARAIDLQYADANNFNSNIDTIVMNGGGNDILIPAMTGDFYGCRTKWYRKNISSSCKNLINNVYVNTVNLMNTMDTNGVQNIVYLGYYELPRGNANLGSALEFGVNRLAEACTNSNANCDFVDSRGSIPANFVLDDDIHPTSEGSQVLADLVWPSLQGLL